jgi:hypothetical protein
MPTRQGIMFAINMRYASRFHMLLVVAASIAVAVLVTRMLLAFGVDTLWHRYIPALLSAYCAFFLGVWAWLHLSEYGRHLRASSEERSRFDGDIGIPELPLPRVGAPSGVDAAPHPGGGTFDGGGASAAWDSGEPLSAGSPLDSATELPDVSLDVGGDEGGFLLVIALILMAAALALLFGAAGYVIWQAPAILAEVVFEVLLASPFIKGARNMHGRDWSRALFLRTWKPFALVSGAALLFAIYAGAVAPQARTAMEVLRVLPDGKR